MKAPSSITFPWRTWKRRPHVPACEDSLPCLGHAWYRQSCARGPEAWTCWWPRARRPPTPDSRLPSLSRTGTLYWSPPSQICTAFLPPTQRRGNWYTLAVLITLQDTYQSLCVCVRMCAWGYYSLATRLIIFNHIQTNKLLLLIFFSETENSTVHTLHAFFFQLWVILQCTQNSYKQHK